MQRPLDVLIIEDQPDDALLAVYELKRGGFAPRHRCVQDQAGIIAALDSHWDLVLCDYSMPNMDAATVVRMIAKDFPLLPVIIVSGAVGEEDAADLIRDGAVDFVNKANMARLVPSARRALAESAVRRARVEAEEALSKSEERYRSLFGNLPVGVFRIDAEGRFMSANPALREMLGVHTVYEIVRSNVDDVLVDRDLLQGLRQQIREGVRRLEVETQIRPVGAPDFWALISMTAHRGEDGRVLHVDGVVQDIDARKRLENALSRGKREWENTFDAVGELILVLDEEGRISRCNRAFADRLSDEFPLLPGRSVHEFLGDPVDLKDGETLASVIRAGHPRDMSFASDLLRGEFQFSLSPRHDQNGRNIGTILVGRDVTTARSQDQLDRLRSSIFQAEMIFRTLRHELGNTLNTLKTTISVMRIRLDTIDEEHRESYFDRCFATLGIAERLLRSLRSYESFDRLKLEPMSLSRFLDQRMELAFEAAYACSITCGLETCGEDLVVMADGDALVRIIVNLVDNAIAAVEGRDAPRISISCGSQMRSAVLEIQDNGRGIATSELPLVFAPLHTTRSDGSGMGLAIVQKLMVGMGGVATIESEEGVGTTVSLRFPLYDPAGPGTDDRQ